MIGCNPPETARPLNVWREKADELDAAAVENDVSGAMDKSLAGERFLSKPISEVQVQARVCVAHCNVKYPQSVSSVSEVAMAWSTCVGRRMVD